ncbi:MAG: MoaD/ThiS family protein [Bacillota bacterium]|nr:MoaD/ThiS family protein [Bacillota bacterium]MDW7678838.1 MoaD/ThiS family protein [Bacillota bacterium]
MRITVKLFGTLRRFSTPQSPGFWTGELPDESTVHDLIKSIGAEVDEVAAASINGTVRRLDTKIDGNDEILLVTTMGAG